MSKWKCDRCKWEGTEDEINKEEYFKETRLEPAEWVWYCPICHSSDHLEENEGFWCKGCEDVQVQHDDEYCPECYQEMINDQQERWKDNQLLEE